MNKKWRNYGIDIVRIIAAILVLCVHFFLNTKYYSTPISGVSMRFQSIIRNFCMICVPLFMIITGYLNKKTKYDKSFVISLLNLLLVWFFYSLIEYFVLNLINGNISSFNFKEFIFSLTSFKACGYSWYIEMYIGLYLISPIINSAFDSFDEKNKKILFFVSVLGLILPNFINNILKNIIHIPNWWEAVYPLAYYITGKYISHINPKIKKKNLILLLFLTQILTFSYSYISTIDFSSLMTYLSSIIVFLIFYDIEIKNEKIKNITKYMSSITLDIYLGSSLIDKIIYPIFNEKMELINITQQYIILYAPIVLIIIFILCVIYGSIRKLIINVR